MPGTDIETHASLIARLNADVHLQLDWEAVLETAYSRFLQPGHVVADIGAHVGRHLTRMVSLIAPGGQAIAFEPLPFAFDSLRKLDLGPHVVLHNMALSDVSGRSTFIHAEGTPEESGLRARIYNHPELARPREIDVEVRRLDEFTAGFDRLDYVKIDAEGGEIGILHGGSETLKRLRPIISAEYGGSAYGAYGHTPATLFDLCREHGYLPCDLFGAAAHSMEVWRNVCDRAAWDWFLVPEERLAAWQQAMAADMPATLREAEAVRRRQAAEDWRRHQAAEASHAQQELEALRAETLHAQQEAERLGQEVAALHGSTSWKLTAPLRSVSAVLRGR